MLNPDLGEVFAAARIQIFIREEMMMNAVMINEEKCVGCSLCVRDCPNSYLYLENGKAHTNGTGCIECGHCYAICPQNAIGIKGYSCDDEAVVPMTEIDSDTLLAAMKSRRSIRQFTSQPVEKEKLRKILDAGRYAPTGANAQDISYTILGRRQEQAEKICVSLFRKGKEIGAPFFSYLRKIEITDDFFFKGAPLVIAVSGKNKINASLASAYMELMAESLGLGVLYSGFFAVCAKFSGRLRKLIRLPKGEEVVSCLIIGYPAVKYQRIVPRKKIRARKL